MHDDACSFQPEKPQLGLPARKMASAAALKPQRWAIWLGLHAFCWVALFQWFEGEQNMTKYDKITSDCVRSLGDAHFWWSFGRSFVS
jgi:hypothetical protein